MNRKLKFFIIPLVGLGLLAGTAGPVLARSHAPNESTPAVSRASDSKSDKHADAPKPRQHVVKGTVQSVSGNTITLTSGATITVDSATKYTAPGKPAATLADVVKDAEVVAQVRDSEGGPVASGVHVLGDMDRKSSTEGVVTAYTAGSSITINDDDGNPVTFVINADTKIKYPGDITTIVPGDSVKIMSIKGTDGTTLTATVIGVQVKRVVEGAVTALTADSMTVKPAAGAAITVKLGADTIYTIKGKSGVAVGDTVTVLAERQSDGTLLARAVFDGVKAPEPKGQGERMEAESRGNPEKMTPKFTPRDPAPKAKPKD